MDHRVICKHCGIDYPPTEFLGTPRFCCRFCWNGVPGELRTHHGTLRMESDYGMDAAQPGAPGRVGFTDGLGDMPCGP